MIATAALLLLTVVAVLDLAASTTETPVAAAQAEREVGGLGISGSRGPPVAEENTSPLDPEALPSAELPEGGRFSTVGAGAWHLVGLPTGPAPAAPAPAVEAGPRTLTYTVEVENGVDPASYGGDPTFAADAAAVLDDPRGWGPAKDVRFVRVDRGTPDFRLSLTTPTTLRSPELCGYAIRYEGSCYNGAAGRVVINLARWTRGALAFDGNLGAYRAYVITHEVGHVLDEGHQGCAVDGAPAPIMMQQTYGTANDYVAQLNAVDAYNKNAVPRDGKVCTPNPWPIPTGGA